MANSMEWKKIGGAQLNDEWKERLDQWAEVMLDISTTLEVVEKALNKVARLVDIVADFLDDFLSAILSWAQDFIEDILNTGMSMCVHHNVKANQSFRGKDNTWRKVLGVDPGLELAMPIRGTGLGGWMYDVGEGSIKRQERNFPPGDEDANVGMAIFVWGFPLDLLKDSIGIIQILSKLWPQFADIGNYLTKMLKDPWKPTKRAARLGLGAMHYDNLADEIREHLHEKYTKDWAGIKDFNQILTLGAKPVWMSVAIADFCGSGVKRFFQNLQDLCNTFIKASSHAIVEFIQAIGRFVALLGMLAKKISDMLQLVDDFIEAINRAYFIAVTAYPKGVPVMGSISEYSIEAQKGSGIAGTLIKAYNEGTGDVPEFSNDAVVFGVVAAYTDPSIMKNIAMLLALFMDPESIWEMMKKAWDQEMSEWKALGDEIDDAWSNDTIANAVDDPSRGQGNEVPVQT
tara:strand:+ start:8663 stop:10036 length:1374 start_codon:yes stop_codon:yes gene_type:complete